MTAKLKTSSSPSISARSRITVSRKEMTKSSKWSKCMEKNKPNKNSLKNILIKISNPNLKKDQYPSKKWSDRTVLMGKKLLKLKALRKTILLKILLKTMEGPKGKDPDKESLWGITRIMIIFEHLIIGNLFCLSYWMFFIRSMRFMKNKIFYFYNFFSTLFLLS